MKPIGTDEPRHGFAIDKGQERAAGDLNADTIRDCFTSWRS
jgi:hypothetical protein